MIERMMLEMMVVVTVSWVLWLSLDSLHWRRRAGVVLDLDTTVTTVTRVPETQVLGTVMLRVTVPHC